MFGFKSRYTKDLERELGACRQANAALQKHVEEARADLAWLNRQLEKERAETVGLRHEKVILKDDRDRAARDLRGIRNSIWPRVVPYEG